MKARVDLAGETARSRRVGTSSFPNQAESLMQRTPFLRVTISGRFPLIKNLPTQQGDCGRTRKGGCSERSLRDTSVYKRNALQKPLA